MPRTEPCPARGSGNFVFVAFHARLRVLAAAARSSSFAGAARHGFLIRPRRVVAATGLSFLGASRLLTACAIGFGLWGGVFLRRWCRWVLGRGLSPGRKRQGQDECG